MSFLVLVYFIASYYLYSLNTEEANKEKDKANLVLGV